MCAFTTLTFHILELRCWSNISDRERCPRDIPFSLSLLLACQDLATSPFRHYNLFSPLPPPLPSSSSWSLPNLEARLRNPPIVFPNIRASTLGDAPPFFSTAVGGASTSPVVTLATFDQWIWKAYRQPLLGSLEGVSRVGAGAGWLVCHDNSRAEPVQTHWVGRGLNIVTAMLQARTGDWGIYVYVCAVDRHLTRQRVVNSPKIVCLSVCLLPH